jgi:biopolymer transport protein ExbB
MNILLQIVETPPVIEASQELSIASLLWKGGVVMIPILILSLITVYVFIERFLYIRSVTKGKKDLMVHVKNRLQQGDIKGARLYAEQESSATGRIILSGLEYVGKPVKDIETMMESSANIEVAEMEKNTGYLGIIASIAPMVGFIGTISGVIRIFYNISLSDNISIGIISGGLYEKMITSGAGLIVGVLAYSGYHYLHLKIQRFTLQVQKDAYEFMRSILSPAS